MLRTVVKVFDERVLKGDNPTCFLKIRAAGRDQFRQGPAPVHRHQLAAQVVVRRVQRDRQLELDALFGQTPDARHNAAGAERDMTRADVDAFLVVENTQGAQDVIVIIKRLPHAHDDNVAGARQGGLRAG